jgi:hypothetical protein
LFIGCGLVVRTWDVQCQADSLLRCCGRVPLSSALTSDSR